MKAKSRQSGVTLTEITVVVGIVALLVAIGVPAIRAFYGSFESEGSVRGMISTGLTTARAIAAREQRYAGIRCQQDLRGYQYMIFIIHDPTLVDRSGFPVTLSGFRAVEGLEPVRLPEAIGVMEHRWELFEVFSEPERTELITDATTFSVIFSPAGRLVTRNVHVLRRNPDDTVFNDPSMNPMFADDDSGEGRAEAFGLHPESSQTSFVIYDKTLFNKLESEQGSEYLQSLERIFINAYTGKMISVDK